MNANILILSYILYTILTTYWVIIIMKKCTSPEEFHIEILKLSLYERIIIIPNIIQLGLLAIILEIMGIF